jgi:hypothetical protein
VRGVRDVLLLREKERHFVYSVHKFHILLKLKQMVRIVTVAC